MSIASAACAQGLVLALCVLAAAGSRTLAHLPAGPTGRP